MNWVCLLQQNHIFILNIAPKNGTLKKVIACCYWFSQSNSAKQLKILNWVLSHALGKMWLWNGKKEDTFLQLGIIFFIGTIYIWRKTQCKQCEGQSGGYTELQMMERRLQCFIRLTQTIQKVCLFLFFKYLCTNLMISHILL